MINEKLKQVAVKLLQEKPNISTRVILATYGKELLNERREAMAKIKHNRLPLDTSMNSDANQLFESYGLVPLKDLLQDGETWPTVMHYKIWDTVITEAKKIQLRYDKYEIKDIAAILKTLFAKEIAGK